MGSLTIISRYRPRYAWPFADFSKPLSRRENRRCLSIHKSEPFEKKRHTFVSFKTEMRIWKLVRLQRPLQGFRSHLCRLLGPHAPAATSASIETRCASAADIADLDAATNIFDGIGANSAISVKEKQLALREILYIWKITGFLRRKCKSRKQNASDFFLCFKFCNEAFDILMERALQAHYGPRAKASLVL